MLDPLSWLVIFSQDYLAGTRSAEEYKAKACSLITEFNENELKALADVISAYAILLRGRGH